MTLKCTDIEMLVELFNASGWKEMHLKYDGDELFLSKDPASLGPAFQLSATSAPRSGFTAEPGPALTSPTPAPVDSLDHSGWVEIKASNLGTFYRASNPEAEPYVIEGAQVSEETEICLIEVMKLFTTIRAGVPGTVREIVAKDGDMVEFGDTLMWIEPEA